MTTTTVLPAWPPHLDEAQKLSLCAQSTDYAISHSILYRPLPLASSSSPPLDAAIHAPISLFPSPFPKALYTRGQELQPLYNDLYSRIAVDDDFLKRVIGGNVILVDDFQKNLWEIWQKIKQEEAVQPLHLGLFRSDYLLHQESDSAALEIKQVEINTISSSFGPLCTRVSDMHRHLTSSSSYDAVSPHLKLSNMPKNEALSTLAAGLAAGHKAYLDATSSSDARILFVVQGEERNVFDQRLIEYELLEKHSIRVERATFKQLEGGASLAGPSRTLQYSRPKSASKPLEISVVYFRAGYSPADYPSEAEWQTRLTLERSQAIKCPTIALQLAGAKKVQQVLSNPKVLEAFVKDPIKGKVWTDEQVNSLQGSFMPMFGMEEEGDGDQHSVSEKSVSGIQIASNVVLAKDYVLKPQREGGGNNVYREEIPLELARLEKLDQERGVEGVKRREGYILMKLIQPPTNLGNYLIRSGNDKGAVLATDVISELGIFGTILFQEQEKGIVVKYEKSGGHLLRTKGRESDEGGVAVGYSVIDSPLLL
ncbi:hypothetical protein CBS101457_000362 [Exobasidium rhododendri]|nr:hypothetical protein CBS101457_000362 [Exobasidium rhododendri]